MASSVANIVVVDDHVSYAEAIGLAISLTPDLELAGRAHDITSALELCDRAKPDLILSDYRLAGGETGTALASQLRDAKFTNPIIILTGFLAPQVRREAGELDNVDAISKDESITSIIQLVRSRVFGAEMEVDPTADVPKMMLSPGELEVLELCLLYTSPSPRDS